MLVLPFTPTVRTISLGVQYPTAQWPTKGPDN